MIYSFLVFNHPGNRVFYYEFSFYYIFIFLFALLPVVTVLIFGRVKNWLATRIASLIFGYISCLFIIAGFFSSKDFFAAAAAMAALATILYMAYTAQQNKIGKSSEFYLKQIKEYFEKAGRLISHEDNNNVRWHQGIENLSAAIELSKYITEKEHKVIFLTDCINIVYQLTNALTYINDFRFFYGLKSYYTDSADDLFFRSFDPEKGVVRCIDPKALLYIKFFLCEISGVKKDLSDGKNHVDIFDNGYIKTPFSKLYDDDIERCRDNVNNHLNFLAQNRGFGFHQEFCDEFNVSMYINKFILQVKVRSYKK